MVGSWVARGGQDEYRLLPAGSPIKAWPSPAHFLQRRCRCRFSRYRDFCASKLDVGEGKGVEWRWFGALYIVLGICVYS